MGLGIILMEEFEIVWTSLLYFYKVKIVTGNERWVKGAKLIFAGRAAEE